MSDRQFIYHMHGLSKTYQNGKKVLENIHLSFYPDAKIGIIGVNGAGKSTVVKIMAGLDKDFNGEAWAAKWAKVGYLSQEPQLDKTKNVLENIMEGVAAKQAKLDRYNELAMEYSDDTAEEMAKLQDEIDAENLWDLESKVEQAMDALRCPPSDANVESLSGGEKRRVALCKLLLEKPDLLLLDEPTNHLDAETVSWLEQHLRDYKGAVILITHDRYFLDNVVGWILELDRGKGIPYQGNYSSWLEQKAKRLEQESRDDAGRQRALNREMEWAKSSPSARRTKSKARLSTFEELKEEVESAEKRAGAANIVIPTNKRLGREVVEFKNVTKSFGDKLLFENLSFRLPRGGIVGVIGANGAGKTTLFKMIIGTEKPDSGDIKIGETVDLGYVDQSRDHLNDDKNVWEEISGGMDVIMLGTREIHSRAYVGAFNFKGSDQQKIVGKLSGGERNRVHMAKLLKKGGNLMLLDEPTNDLDVETLQSLEAALEDFNGCAVIISHDRWFLDRLATHILAFEGNSHVEWFEGNFEMYLEDKRRRLGDAAVEPQRIKYRKFSRG